MSVDQPKVPDGMRYHVIDVYVDELDRADAARAGEVPIAVVLGPLRRLGKESLNKVVRAKVEEALRDERLKDWLGEEAEEEEEEWNGIED
jgi:ribosomal RNA-processing protein 1